MQHPLLNKDSSKHYNMIDGVEAIQRLEEMYTTEDLATWAKITAMKYRLRIGHKDEPHKEMAKIKTYEAYYEYLNNIESDVTDEEQATLDKMDNCMCLVCQVDRAIKGA